jgi:vacuolar-type H+-ATPase subunit D/Vma8
MYERPPPGRAGHRWLHERIAAAERGVDLLDDKRLLLLSERQRRVDAGDLARARWLAAAAQVDSWTRRLAVTAGTAGVTLAAREVAGRASLTVTWRNTMGVVLPESATCSAPALPALEVAVGSATLSHVAAACREALSAAADVAVSAHALDRIDAELHASQRRLLAIRDHRLPLLRRQLLQLDQQLDELDRAERLTIRWCQGRQGA